MVRNIKEETDSIDLDILVGEQLKVDLGEDNEELAEGVSGKVYEAKGVVKEHINGVEVVSEGPFAVKEFRSGEDTSVESSLVGLNHPNLVKIFHKGEIGEKEYILMERTDTTLGEQRVKGDIVADLTLEEIFNILAGMSHGLEYAHHKKGIAAHLDLHTFNIHFVDGVVKLSDFGRGTFVEGVNKEKVFSVERQTSHVIRETDFQEPFRKYGPIHPDVLLNKVGEEKHDVYSLAWIGRDLKIALSNYISKRGGYGEVKDRFRSLDPFFNPDELRNTPDELSNGLRFNSLAEYMDLLAKEIGVEYVHHNLEYYWQGFGERRSRLKNHLATANEVLQLSSEFKLNYESAIAKHSLKSEVDFIFFDGLDDIFSTQRILVKDFAQSYSAELDLDLLGEIQDDNRLDTSILGIDSRIKEIDSLRLVVGTYEKFSEVIGASDMLKVKFDAMNSDVAVLSEIREGLRRELYIRRVFKDLLEHGDGELPSELRRQIQAARAQIDRTTTQSQEHYTIQTNFKNALFEACEKIGLRPEDGEFFYNNLPGKVELLNSAIEGAFQAAGIEIDKTTTGFEQLEQKIGELHTRADGYDSLNSACTQVGINLRENPGGHRHLAQKIIELKARPTELDSLDAACEKAGLEPSYHKNLANVIQLLKDNSKKLNKDLKKERAKPKPKSHSGFWSAVSGVTGVIAGAALTCLVGYYAVTDIFAETNALARANQEAAVTSAIKRTTDEFNTKIDFMTGVNVLGAGQLVKQFNEDKTVTYTIREFTVDESLFDQGELDGVTPRVHSFYVKNHAFTHADVIFNVGNSHYRGVFTLNDAVKQQSNEGQTEFIESSLGGLVYDDGWITTEEISLNNVLHNVNGACIARITMLNGRIEGLEKSVSTCTESRSDLYSDLAGCRRDRDRTGRKARGDEKALASCRTQLRAERANVDPCLCPVCPPDQSAKIRRLEGSISSLKTQLIGYDICQRRLAEYSDRCKLP